VTERTLNPTEVSDWIKQQDRVRAVSKVKQEQANLERDGQRWEQYKRKCAVKSRSGPRRDGSKMRPSGQ
jgi:hypothetical protein